jgi:hypothetical protein
LRAQILAIKACVPVTDNHGNFIGNCCAFWICSACTGSDIGGGGQITPGSVSLDGESQGQAFFITHNSAAFEEWASDYKALLASYGIESILGKTFQTLQVPMTGDKDFDKLYDESANEFNPPEQKKDEGVYVDGSRVANSWDEFLKMKVVIPGGRTPEDMKKEQEWTDENLPNTNTIQVNNDNSIDANETHPAERSWGEAILRTALGLVPSLEGLYAKFAVNLTDGTFSNMNEAVGALASQNEAQQEEIADKSLGGGVFFNAVGKTGGEAILDAAGEKTLEVSGEALKESYSLNGVSTLVDQGNLGIAPLKELNQNANMGMVFQKYLYKGTQTFLDLLENKKGE